jgi:hypothetical protein
MATDTDIDRQARELHDPRYIHTEPGCGRRLTLAELLAMRAAGQPCPHCGQYTLMGLAPDVTPARADDMLRELRARRRELGLEADHA